MNKTLTTILLSSALALSSAAYAGHGPRDMMGPGVLLSERIAERLELTDEQQLQISERIELYRSEYPKGEGREAFAGHREAMKALMEQETFDETAARALLSEGTERRLVQMKLRHDLAQILTDEQRESLEQMQRRRGEKHRKGRDTERSRW
ncbi:Spy/CpxP family protein refolding chaperone [uncultured Gilvimarinus sp.]|uniref:Spy/CpxP family protein refolding chaperone n=1 Tax=uncultured Gilvimarinus sp. TaxID=1689143 RepID=UPI0030EBC0DA|tara:strand:- start:746 stop:1198 length:453 start_codon:yes stop_codon:yes gene_type:complete